MLGKREDPVHGQRKSYTDEFRRQAVDLYESTPGATLKGIAEDLAISPPNTYENQLMATLPEAA